jgi:hypothetical protein
MLENFLTLVGGLRAGGIERAARQAHADFKRAPCVLGEPRLQDAARRQALWR